MNRSIIKDIPPFDWSSAWELNYPLNQFPVKTPDKSRPEESKADILPNLFDSENNESKSDKESNNNEELSLEETIIIKKKLRKDYFD